MLSYCLSFLRYEEILSSFRLDRRERFSSCRRVTQRIREVRSTAVGNTMLGDTVQHMLRGEIRCRKTRATPSPGHLCTRHTNCMRARAAKYWTSFLKAPPGLRG